MIYIFIGKYGSLTAISFKKSTNFQQVQNEFKLLINHNLINQSEIIYISEICKLSNTCAQTKLLFLNVAQYVKVDKRSK